MKKINIFFDEELLKELKGRIDPVRGNLSEQIRESLSRYYYLLSWERNSIKNYFTGPELSLLCDIGNGTLFEPHSLNMIVAEIEDAESDYFEKWGVNQKELIIKLNSLTITQSAALVDSIERFWAEIARHESLTQPSPENILK
jgi:hypothetical protein